MSDTNLYHRKDLPEQDFHVPTVKTLRELFNRSELPDDYELLPNKWGNFAIYAITEEGHPRDYIGYIDLHTGRVHCNPKAAPRRVAIDQQNTAPGYHEQAIFKDCQYITITGDEDQSLLLEGWE